MLVRCRRRRRQSCGEEVPPKEVPSSNGEPGLPGEAQLGLASGVEVVRGKLANSFSGTRFGTCPLRLQGAWKEGKGGLGALEEAGGEASVAPRRAIVIVHTGQEGLVTVCTNMERM